MGEACAVGAGRLRRDGMEGRFEVTGVDRATRARLGRLWTRHGAVCTPMFMPVGTQGTVKGLLPEQLRAAGAQIILGNTYHLNLRPGPALIARLGGLHRFMGWEGPILTDSGGFQVFSLAKLRKVEEGGIRFQSHLDGQEVRLTPEGVLDIQAQLGSDIAMVLDECPAADAGAQACELAVLRTLRWARQARAHAERNGMLASGTHVFGIVQGSRYAELRRRCVEELLAVGFSGYAIGGVSVGEPEAEILPQVELTAGLLPADQPRYVMGVGTPPQLLKMIACGADLFDCVMPTREARHGIAFTNEGKLNLKNNRFREDERPLMEAFADTETGRFSRAYIRHLVTSGEMLGAILLTLHNVRFYLDLMRHAREHIRQGDFAAWHVAWIERYNSGEKS